MFIGPQVPYGYKKDPNNNKLIIDEDVKAIILKIFNFALQGKGTVAIAKILTEEKVLDPGCYKASKGDTRFDRFKKDGKGNKWINVTVRKILSDIVYIDDMENRKVEVLNYKTKKRSRVPLEDHIIVKNTHEGIIDRNDFEVVQNMIKSRTHPYVYNHENLFKGLVYCKVCGRRILLTHQKRKNGYVSNCYKCMTHYADKDKCPKANTILYDTLKELVYKRVKVFVNSLLSDDNVISEIKSKLNLSSNLEVFNDRIKKYESRINQLYKIIKKLYEDNLLGIITNEAYQSLLKDYKQEENGLLNKIDELKKQENNIVTNNKNIYLLFEEVKKFKNFKELDKAVINSLISRIELGYREKNNGKETREINIIYRFIEISD